MKENTLLIQLIKVFKENDRNLFLANLNEQKIHIPLIYDLEKVIDQIVVFINEQKLYSKTLQIILYFSGHSWLIRSSSFNRVPVTFLNQNGSRMVLEDIVERIYKVLTEMNEKEPDSFPRIETTFFFFGCRIKPKEIKEKEKIEFPDIELIPHEKIGFSLINSTTLGTPSFEHSRKKEKNKQIWVPFESLFVKSIFLTSQKLKEKNFGINYFMILSKEAIKSSTKFQILKSLLIRDQNIFQADETLFEFLNYQMQCCNQNIDFPDFLKKISIKEVLEKIFFLKNKRDFNSFIFEKIKSIGELGIEKFWSSFKKLIVVKSYLIHPTYTSILP